MGQGQNLGKGINIFIFQLKMSTAKTFSIQKIVNFSVEEDVDVKSFKQILLL